MSGARIFIFIDGEGFLVHGFRVREWPGFVEG